MSDSLFTAIVLILMVALMIHNQIDAPDDQDLALKHHCEMVQIYRDSGGEYGWPDYNNTAHLCTEVQHETQL